MNENILKITPDFILELAVRRRWIILIPLCLALIIGTYLAATLPRIYEAITLIMVEPQRVPQNYVQSIVTVRPGERINTLSQQILSRTNLEKIIKEFGLYTEPEQVNMFMEDKVAALRSQIAINVMSDRGRGTDAFSITMRGKDPQKIARVANGLAARFIDENIKVRESQALGTSNFLDSELDTMRGRLEKLETQIKDYNKTYMGQLPGQLESNLRILDRLQASLKDQEQNARDARARLADLNSKASIKVSINGSNASLDDLRAQLENLRSRYTEAHPDIMRLKKVISELESKQMSASASDSNKQAGSGLTTIPADLRQQINGAKREIQLAENQIVELKNKISVYQKRVEDTPKREQELLSLERDYGNIKNSYSSLLNRKLEAEISVNLERKQKGEQFRVIDHAKAPRKPILPNMQKLFVFVIAAGLGVGGGAAFLMEYMCRSFRRPDEIETYYELPVLTSIPTLYQPRQLSLRRVEHIMSIAFSALTVTFFVVFAFVCIK